MDVGTLSNGYRVLKPLWRMDGQTEIKLDINKLAGRCVGNQFTLLVNGIELGNAQDNDMSIGGIGLGYKCRNCQCWLV